MRIRRTLSLFQLGGRGSDSKAIGHRGDMVNDPFTTAKGSHTGERRQLRYPRVENLILGTDVAEMESCE